MPATTVEQLINRHKAMIGRLSERDTTDIDTPGFIALLREGAQAFATGMTRDLQDAADDLAKAATFLEEALDLADGDPAKTRLLGTANRSLDYVNTLALA